MHVIALLLAIKPGNGQAVMTTTAGPLSATISWLLEVESTIRSALSVLERICESVEEGALNIKNAVQNRQQNQTTVNLNGIADAVATAVQSENQNILEDAWNGREEQQSNLASLQMVEAGVTQAVQRTIAKKIQLENVKGESHLATREVVTFSVNHNEAPKANRVGALRCMKWGIVSSGEQFGTVLVSGIVKEGHSTGKWHRGIVVEDGHRRGYLVNWERQIKKHRELLYDNSRRTMSCSMLRLQRMNSKEQEVWGFLLTNKCLAWGDDSNLPVHEG
ncbi:hypothetical protein BJ742DRAFT_739192 [Cladochytrium replicatum]|nr:hypothetical protein BJ742DRAFT_739192 [Cladochytrium replicatum]